MTEISRVIAPPAPKQGQDMKLWDVAQKLEASFLAEMLKSAGLGEMPNSFSGGAGEEQFQSFLRAEQADLIVKSGGIGLAQSIFEALKGSDDVTL